MLNNKKETDLILPILAILLSIGAISQSFNLTNIPLLIVSLIGIISGILFFLNNKHSLILLQVWVYAQIPAITKAVKLNLQNGMEGVMDIPILDTGQLLTFDVGMTFGSDDAVLNLNMNIVPFFLLILIKILQGSALLNKKVTISSFKNNNKLGDIFPLSGIFERKIDFGKDEHYWLLIKLDKEFIFNSINYNHILVKSKEKKIYKSGKEKYISFMRLVKDPSEIKEDLVNLKTHPFIDWVIINVPKS